MNCSSHPATSPLLDFRENNCCGRLFWCLWKSSEHFLSHSHLCSCSHSQTHSELCLCHYIQQGATPGGYWQSLANMRPATFWELVIRLPPRHLRPLQLAGAPAQDLQVCSRHDHGGRPQNHQLQLLHWRVLLYLNCSVFFPAWKPASRILAVPHLPRSQNLQEGKAWPAAVKRKQEPWPEQERGPCPSQGGHCDSRQADVHRHTCCHCYRVSQLWLVP